MKLFVPAAIASTALAPEQIENTIAHELHHIGLASLGPRYEQSISSLSPEAREVGKWMTASERERWDRDVANVPSDLAKAEARACAGGQPGCNRPAASADPRRRR